jgi:phage tail sheath protein FI
MANLLDVPTKAPGVYVFEETSAVKAIAGVSTSTAGFIGVISTTGDPSREQAKDKDKTIGPTTAKESTFDLGDYPVVKQESVAVSVERTLQTGEYTVDQAGHKVTLKTAPGKDAKVAISYKVAGVDKEDPTAAAAQQVEFSIKETPDDSTVKVTVTTTNTATIDNDDKKGQVKFADQLPVGSTFKVRYQVAATPAAGSTPSAPEGVPILCTHFTEFKQQFGNFDGTATPANYLRHAVFGYFNNGGSRCYVTWVSKNKKIDDALDALATIDEIALVAAPGYAGGDELATHCAKNEGIYYRFAILDGPSTVTDLTSLTKTSPNQGKMPARSDYAAWYFPWIKVFDPEKIEDPGKPEKKGGLLDVPPSGHLAGIYARVDSQRGVHKAPANEAIRGARDVSQPVSKVQQDGLNKEGVNCIRVLNNQILVWGARTLAPSDKPELKYINVRRTLLFLRKSIDQGTQWVVFEPNTRALWKKITRNVTAFLTDVWRSGALFGDTPQEAFYVRCDDELNPLSQREQGLVVTEIGVAIARPAEFVVFRIGQFTASP